MPNADAKNNPTELLMQIESELRQLASQIDSINATIKPWQDELVALRDYRKQLIDLHEAIQKRQIKPRVVKIQRKTIRQTHMDPATQSLIDVLKGLTPKDLARICRQISVNNGEIEEIEETYTTED